MFYTNSRYGVTIADISINVFGEIGDDARAALDPLGAVYHSHIIGFSRY